MTSSFKVCANLNQDVSIVEDNSFKLKLNTVIKHKVLVFIPMYNCEKQEF